MGRGRQKAKHTKVARELKYFSPETNYDALEKELSTPHGDEQYVDKWADDDDEEDDGQYVDTYADDTYSEKYASEHDPQNKSA